MKAIYLISVFLISAITACGHREHGKNEHQNEETNVKSTEEHTAANLVLNDGKKWKLDEPTKENIKLMKQAFDKAKATGKPDYTALAADLQSKTDKLVSECKMSGKDHDMLHVWLSGYLDALKELKSGAEPARETAYHKIEEQLKSFDFYFE